MTRFVIGVGHLSVPGSDIERALGEYYPGSEVNPIQEAPYKEIPWPSLYLRATHFAERMRVQADSLPDYFVGVASGLIRLGIVGTKRMQIARIEVAAVMYLDGATGKATCLNPQDAQWQIKHRVYAQESCLESVTRLILLLHHTAKERVRPKA